MQSNWSHFFACYNCGNHNVIGIRSCRTCNATLYYNCPHCREWVDNTFLNCPKCGMKLNWPDAGTFSENTYIINKSKSPAVLLLFCSVILLIITFALIENNSNSVKAGSTVPTFEALQSTSTNDLQETNTSYKQKPYSPASTPAVSLYTYPGSASSGIQDASSTTDIVIMQPSGTGTSTYVPTGSSYLNTVYPGWGRCSGGRCSAMTQ